MKILYLFLIINSITYGFKFLNPLECPKEDPDNIVAFIDGCIANNAEWVTPIGRDRVCNSTWIGHATSVIETYKNAGGRKKTWLLGLFDNNINSMIYSIRLITKCGVKIINASVGNYNTYNSSEYEEIKLFITKGGRYYAAAGNENRSIDLDPFYPASYMGVIAVGALECENSSCKKASYSNYGKKVHRYEYGWSWDNKRVGTSFACPRAVARDE